MKPTTSSNPFDEPPLIRNQRKQITLSREQLLFVCNLKTNASTQAVTDSFYKLAHYLNVTYPGSTEAKRTESDTFTFRCKTGNEKIQEFLYNLEYQTYDSDTRKWSVKPQETLTRFGIASEIKKTAKSLPRTEATDQETMARSQSTYSQPNNIVDSPNPFDFDAPPPTNLFDSSGAMHWHNFDRQFATRFASSITTSIHSPSVHQSSPLKARDTTSYKEVESLNPASLCNLK